MYAVYAFRFENYLAFLSSSWSGKLSLMYFLLNFHRPTLNKLRAAHAFEKTRRCLLLTDGDPELSLQLLLRFHVLRQPQRIPLPILALILLQILLLVCSHLHPPQLQQSFFLPPSLALKTQLPFSLRRKMRRWILYYSKRCLKWSGMLSKARRLMMISQMRLFPGYSKFCRKTREDIRKFDSNTRRQTNGTLGFWVGHSERRTSQNSRYLSSARVCEWPALVCGLYSWTTSSYSLRRFGFHQERE